MVYDRSLVTDELIEERWEVALNPDALRTARAMYGSASFEMQQQFLATADIPRIGRCCTRSVPHPAHLGPRRQSQPPIWPFPPTPNPEAELHIFPVAATG